MGDIWEEIYHHGIKGQEWGERNGPPYPLDRNAKRQEAKKRRAAERVKRQAAKKRKRMKRAQERIEKSEAKKAEKEKEKNEKAKRDRARYLMSAKETYRHRHEFSAEEIQEAMKRFQWEKTLRELSQSEMEAGVKAINSVLNYGESGIRGWNMIARVANGIAKDEEFLPLIQPPPSGKKDKGKKS